MCVHIHACLLICVCVCRKKLWLLLSWTTPSRRSYWRDSNRERCACTHIIHKQEGRNLGRKEVFRVSMFVSVRRHLQLPRSRLWSSSGAAGGERRGGGGGRGRWGDDQFFHTHTRTHRVHIWSCVCVCVCRMLGRESLSQQRKWKRAIWVTLR